MEKENKELPSFKNKEELEEYKQKNLSKIQEELEKFNQEYEILKKEMEKPIERTGFKKPSIFKKFYAIPLGLIGIFVTLFILLLIFQVHKIYIFVLAIFTLPVAFIIFLYGLARLYIDKKRIKNKIIPILPDKKFIVANFFLPQKRIIRELFLINDDGKSFNSGKDKVYIIDYEKIWYDTENYPNSYYLPNLPNPMSFNFGGQIQEYAELLKQYKTVENITFKDWSGKDVDISYSSQNLGELKKDKFVNELHRDQEAMKEFKQIVGFMVIIIVLLIVALIIFFIVK